MKKKPVKDPRNPLGKKIPHPTQSFVPLTTMKNIRELQNFQCNPSKLAENEVYVPEAEPYEIPQEWVDKTEDEFTNELTSELPYQDPFHNQLEHNLPLSLIKAAKHEFSWLRPDDYIINHNLDREIKRIYPKKNTIVTREDIKVFYKKIKEEQIVQEGQEEDNEINTEEFLRQDSVSLKRTIYKDFYSILDEPLNMRIVNCREREETDEEYQKRYEEEERIKQEMMRLKSKTIQKKIEIKPKPNAQIKHEDIQDRLIIYEPEPSQLDVRFLIASVTAAHKQIAILHNSFLSWLSSIFQFILDLNIIDCIGKKHIFSNIYPQKGGVPVYNPSGHYAIKLYFMGKPRRIDIDDRIPCNKDGEFIFPKCESLNELWPALFTKALLKLNIYKVKHPSYTCEEEIVDTSYIYALTGFHSEIITNKGLDKIISQIFQNTLNDDMVINKKKYLLCLNLKKDDNGKNHIYYDEEIERYEEFKRPIIETQTANIPTQSSDIQGTAVRRSTRFKTRSSFIYKHLSSVLDTTMKKETVDEFVGRHSRKEKTLMNQPKFSLLDNKLKVISNYAYSINDFFCNNTFNMNRLKPLDFSDLKRTLKDSVVIFKQLTPSEKKEYIHQRRELKMIQNEIKQRRIEDLKNDGRPYMIVKIKNCSLGQYKISSILSYDEDEIIMAKKCLLNSWKYPPPKFFEEYFKRYSYLNMLPSSKDSTEEIKKKAGSLDWTNETYVELIGDVSPYSASDIKEPIIKQSGGNWIDINDFKSLFNTFLVLNNSTALFPGGNIAVDNNWNYYNIDVYEPLNDYFVFKLSSKNIEVKALPYAAFITFQPNDDKTLASRDKINSYIIIDIYDEQKMPIQSDIKMNAFYSTYYMNNFSGEQNYYIIIKGGIYPFGFYLQLFSEAHALENMSYINYFKAECDYSLSEFKIEHPIIEKDSFYLISRILIEPIKVEGQENNNAVVPDANPSIVAPGELKVMIDFKYPIKYLKSFFQIIIAKPADNYQGQEIKPNELITLPEGKYFIIISLNKPKYYLKENTVDISIVQSNKAYKIEQIENIDPYRFSDYYTPNRHNIVFREIIYSSDIVHTSLDILFKKSEEEVNTSSMSDQKKENKAIRLKFLLYQINDEGEEINPKFSHALKGHLLTQWESFDSLTIHHLTLAGGLIQPEDPRKKPKPNEIIQPAVVYHPYLFISYIEIDPNSKKLLSQYKYQWFTTVFPSDSLCFIKDCSKVNHEKELKDNWESTEPGRSNKAHHSRKRFILDIDMKHGKTMTEEDKKFLIIPRERKLTPANDDLNQQKNQGKKVVNKKESPIKKGQTAQINVNASQPITHNTLTIDKRLPLEKEHCATYVKKYLGYAYKNRTINIESSKDQFSKTINNESIVQEKTHHINERHNYFNQTARSEFHEKFSKSEPVEVINSFYKTNSSFRSKKKDNLRDLTKFRDSLKQEFQIKINATKSAQDVIANYISYNYDINYMISVYKETEPVLKRENELIQKLFSLICTKKEDQIKNDLKKYTAKDKNTIMKVLEEIQYNQWIIKDEIITKLKDLIK